MNDEDIKHRIKNAIIMLTAGTPFSVAGLGIRLTDKFHLTICGGSSCYYLENITKYLALKDLEEIKKLFLEMVEISPELADFIKDKEMEYSLVYDYGQGGISICRETKGQLIWELNSLKQ